MKYSDIFSFTINIMYSLMKQILGSIQEETPILRNVQLLNLINNNYSPDKQPLILATFRYMTVK